MKPTWGGGQRLVKQLTGGPRREMWTALYWLTDSMEPRNSWKANNHSASQEIPHFLWNPKVHSQGPATDPYREPHETSSHPPNLSPKSVSMLSSTLRLDLSSGLLLSGFPTKIMYTFLISPCVLHSPPILVTHTSLSKANWNKILWEHAWKDRTLAHKLTIKL
jgi:hypothetical protein